MGYKISSAKARQDTERWWSVHDKTEYVCPDCGRGYDEVRRFEVHHIDYDERKIVGLCQSCHYIRHGAKRRNVNVEWWKEEFLQLGD